LKGVGDTVGNTVGALVGGLGSTLGGVAGGAKETVGLGGSEQKGVQVEDLEKASKEQKTE